MISLGNIVGKCDDDTQSQLKDVIRILSSAELYTPKVMRFQENDRITSGYYDGLIRVRSVVHSTH
jgi:hypothetical protein